MCVANVNLIRTDVEVLLRDVFDIEEVVTDFEFVINIFVNAYAFSSTQCLVILCMFCCCKCYSKGLSASGFDPHHLTPQFTFYKTGSILDQSTSGPIMVM